MTLLFGLLYTVLIGALLRGQAHVVMRAVRKRTAGVGRFTYELHKAPVGFWIALLLETIGLLAVVTYLISALIVVVTGARG